MEETKKDKYIEKEKVIQMITKIIREAGRNNFVYKRKLEEVIEKIKETEEKGEDEKTKRES